jgi:hypothetical protein
VDPGERSESAAPGSSWTSPSPATNSAARSGPTTTGTEGNEVQRHAPVTRCRYYHEHDEDDDGSASLTSSEPSSIHGIDSSEPFVSGPGNLSRRSVGGRVAEA